MSVAPWKKQVASFSASLLESVGGPKIGGGLKTGSDMPPLPLGIEWINVHKEKPTADTTDTFYEFWSCQCSPCIATIPKMKRLYSGYRNKIQFRTLHVNLHGANKEEILQFLRDYGIDYPVGIDQDNESWETFGFTHLPHGLLVNAKGTVRWSGSLFTHDVEQVMQQFHGNLAPASLTTDKKDQETPVAIVARAVECSGGVCSLPSKKPEPPLCEGGVCRLPPKK